MANDPDIIIPKFIRRFMPSASEAELFEATETFKQYLAIVRRIYERIAHEKLDTDSPDCTPCGRFNDVPHDV